MIYFFRLEKGQFKVDFINYSKDIRNRETDISIGLSFVYEMFSTNQLFYKIYNVAIFEYILFSEVSEV